jgi:hypothetical protein
MSRVSPEPEQHCEDDGGTDTQLDSAAGSDVVGIGQPMKAGHHVTQSSDIPPNWGSDNGPPSWVSDNDPPSWGSDNDPPSWGSDNVPPWGSDSVPPWGSDSAPPSGSESSDNALSWGSDGWGSDSSNNLCVCKRRHLKKLNELHENIAILKMELEFLLGSTKPRGSNTPVG